MFTFKNFAITSEVNSNKIEFKVFEDNKPIGYYLPYKTTKVYEYKDVIFMITLVEFLNTKFNHYYSISQVN